MDKKPKTKEVVRTIKEHTAGVVKDKAAAVGVKTKDTEKSKVEEQFSPQQGRNQEQSPESYASDQVAEIGERAAEDAAVVGKRAVNTTVRKVKDKLKEKRTAEQQAEEMPDAEEPELPNPTEAEQPDAPASESSQPGSDRAPASSEEKPQNPTERTVAKNDATKKEPSNQEHSESGARQKQDAKKLKEARASKEKSSESSSKKSGSEQPSQNPKQKSQSEKPMGDDKAETPAEKGASADKAQGSKIKQKNASEPKTGVRVESEKKEIRRKTPEQTAIKERTRSAPKEAFKSETDVVEREIRPRTKQKTPPKQRGQRTVKNTASKPGEPRITSPVTRRTKEIEHGAAKTIKTADKSFKKAERTAKATKKATEATVKAAKRSEEAARRTAKVAVQATKAAIKATIAGIKAAVAAAKELIAAAAAGAPAAIVIIIVICLIAAVGGTCFGIFLSNDKTTGTKITMPEAISQLTAEHYSDLTDLKSKYTYDTMEVEGGASMAINWKDVLAVYAVKTTTSTENAYEVVTMDDVKMNLLRDVISDMNKFVCVVVPTVVSETVTETDEHGNTVTTTKYVTKNILKVTVIRLTVDQIIEQYHFNEEQKKQLTELMSSDYDDLWQNIIGTTGDVLITNSTYIPTDIFAWPLQDNGNITSGYGYRHDPKTGEWKLHGGTDIAAPTGTPILASADGVVIAATWHNSYGYYVKIQHNDTFATLYGHCSALHVVAGQQVKQGQVIADVGQTGYGD